MKTMSVTPRLTPHPTHPFLMGVVALVVVFSAAAIGNLATMPNIPTWYAYLTKPSFNPPNAVFGPVWGVLYVSMAYAFWRVLTLPAAKPGKKAAIGWFVGQMILNAAWSVAFFGMQSPFAGLAVIALLIVALLVTLIRFRALDQTAGLLLVPYLAWVCFAAALNASIWWLNQ
jgi:translocator protein